jgi:tryptophan synthase alpha chain
MGEVVKIKERLSLIKQYTKLPVCVGFGVKTEKQAKEIASFADGVVVGSHFVNQITSNMEDKRIMIASLSASASAMALSMHQED